MNKVGRQRNGSLIPPHSFAVLCTFSLSSYLMSSSPPIPLPLSSTSPPPFSTSQGQSLTVGRCPLSTLKPDFVCLSVFKAFVHFSLNLLLISSVTEKVLVLGLIASLTDLLLPPACGRMRWFVGRLCVAGSASFPPVLTSLYDWTRTDLTSARRNDKHLLNNHAVYQRRTCKGHKLN